MIIETATLTIDPKMAARFEAAVAEAAQYFKDDEGCSGMALERAAEIPGTYFLKLHWDSIDAHRVGFQLTENFQKWRAIAGPFFLAPPVVIYSETARSFF